MAEQGTTDDRSIRLPLATPDDMRITCVTDERMDRDVISTLRYVYGETSTTVLWSLKEFGVPAERDEIAELRAQIESGGFLVSPGASRSIGQRRRAAALAWRLMAHVGRLTEQLAALTEAIGRWYAAGRPLYVECTMGADYLRFKGDVAAVLRARSDPPGFAALMGAPPDRNLVRYLDAGEIRVLRRHLDRTAEEGAALMGGLAALAGRDLLRTFIRWKHPVSITSPSVAPLWLPDPTPQQRADVLRLETGFGIIDLEPRATRPEVIIWPAEPDDLQALLQACEDAFTLADSLIQWTLRWALGHLPIIPAIIGGSPMGGPARAAYARLQSGRYRAEEIRRRWIEPELRRQGAIA